MRVPVDEQFETVFKVLHILDRLPLNNDTEELRIILRSRVLPAHIVDAYDSPNMPKRDSIRRKRAKQHK